MPRKKTTFPDLKEASHNILYDRLDMDNINWGILSNLGEWCNLDAIINIIGYVMYYNRPLIIDGCVVSAGAYLNGIKNLYYSPDLSAAYERYKDERAIQTICRWPGFKPPEPVKCELLQAVHDIASKQRRSHRKRARKFQTDQIMPN